MFKCFEKRNNLTKIVSTIVLLVLVLGLSPLSHSVTYALEENKRQNINVNLSSSGSKPSYSLLDPNPDLIDEHGNLINDTNLAASLTTYRNGAIADGVSRLLVVIDSNNTLQFSIEGTTADDLTNGVLSSLDKPYSEDKSSSTVNVDPWSANNRSIVAAVYTPPDNIDLAENISHRTVNILTNDTNNSLISIQLYRPPVVLVHGLWMNSDNTWITTNFANKLTESGFNYAFADYERHNSKTFDPYAIKTMGGKPFGNYGIDSIRNTINNILKAYQYFSIAASQVDIVAHSMGGLMARGFVQQPDYKEEDNFMKGSIHRLITIGTPHYGGPLSKFLYEHRDDWYCFFSEKPGIFPAERCNEPIQLETFYKNYNRLIVQGGVKSLIPESDAYSHLCQTNVGSYAIAGNWKPDADASHSNQEGLYKVITENNTFNLDRDVLTDQNDLVVSVTSQLGGLPNQIRQLGSNDIPNNSSVYADTVHTTGYIIRPPDTNISSETDSTQIQNDVIKLLSISDDNKFADAIGIGSPCHIPE